MLRPTTFLFLTGVLFSTNSVMSQSEIVSVFSDSIGSTTIGDLLKGVPSDGVLNETCFDQENGYSNLKSCLQDQCVGSEDVARLYNMSLDTLLDQGSLGEVAPAVLYTLNQRNNCLAAHGDTGLKEKPSASAVWGYSFLFVTLINLCSLTGVMVLPCMKTSIYKAILMFMVALAVGTLVGSSVLVLIPEAFELSSVGGGHSDEKTGKEHDYLWMATSIIGGIYLFFLIERAMRMINIRREKTKELRRQDEMATQGTVTSSFTRQTPHNASLKLKDPAHIHLQDSPSANCLCTLGAEGKSEKNSMDGSDERGASSFPEEGEEGMGTGEGGESRGALIEKKLKFLNGHSHSHSHGGSGGQVRVGGVAPVAYMVIFGDGVHNFIDGLSIGAAFTDSVLLGVSVCVAVICEELPHELGDFAILLNAGMGLRKALMYNFLSSLMCYLGLVIGILVGENTTAHTWIFGLAGGMFLYISLVDMMPEMNSSAESEDGQRFGLVKTFLLQNIGLLTGYTVILILARFGGEISFE